MLTFISILSGGCGEDEALQFSIYVICLVIGVYFFVSLTPFHELDF